MKMRRLQPEDLIDLWDVDEKHVYFISRVKRLPRFVAARDFPQIELNTPKRLGSDAVRLFHLRPEHPVTTIDNQIISAVWHRRLAEKNVLLQSNLLHLQ